MYHPWRRLRALVELNLLWVDTDAYMGRIDYCTSEIRLAIGMTQAERRCTLAHELVHHERGPCAPGDEEREERIVDREAARRLIDIRKLGETLAWSRSCDEAADELWVDVPTLVARMKGLHPAERHYLHERLAHLREGHA